MDAPVVTNNQQPPAGWNHGGRMPAQSMMTFRAPGRPVPAAVSTCVLHNILSLRIIYPPTPLRQKETLSLRVFCTRYLLLWSNCNQFGTSPPIPLRQKETPPPRLCDIAITWAPLFRLTKALHNSYTFWHWQPVKPLQVVVNLSTLACLCLFISVNFSLFVY